MGNVAKLQRGHFFSLIRRSGSSTAKAGAWNISTFRHQFFGLPKHYEDRVAIIAILVFVVFFLGILNLQGYLPERIREFLMPRAYGEVVIEGIELCLNAEKRTQTLCVVASEGDVRYIAIMDGEEVELIVKEENGQQTLVYRRPVRLPREQQYPNKGSGR